MPLLLEEAQEIARRFREKNPHLMALPANHGLRFTDRSSRPRSLDRIRIEKLRYVVIPMYKIEGLNYCAREFDIPRHSLVRSLKAWGVPLNGDFTPNSLKRLSQTVTIWHHQNQHSWIRQATRHFAMPASYYPYILEVPQPPQPEYDLVLAVNEAVPKGLSNDMRADVCQDLLVAILDHQIEVDDLPQAVPEFIKRHFRQFPTKYGPLSLEKPIYEDELTLLDTLHEGNIVRRW